MRFLLCSLPIAHQRLYASRLLLLLSSEYETTRVLPVAVAPLRDLILYHCRGDVRACIPYSASMIRSDLLAVNLADYDG